MKDLRLAVHTYFMPVDLVGGVFSFFPHQNKSHMTLPELLLVLYQRHFPLDMSYCTLKPFSAVLAQLWVCF